jgi:hypothetical protein
MPEIDAEPRAGLLGRRALHALCRLDPGGSGAGHKKVQQQTVRARGLAAVLQQLARAQTSG